MIQILEVEQMYNALLESIEIGKKVCKAVEEDASSPHIRLINVYDNALGEVEGSVVQVYYREVIEGEHPGIWLTISFMVGKTEKGEPEWNVYASPIGEIKLFSEMLTELQKTMAQDEEVDYVWDWRVLSLKNNVTEFSVNIKEKDADTDE